MTTQILLVDDHSLVLEGINKVLEKIPETEITSTTSGKKAAELIAAKYFDLYILDLEIPETNGFELINIIRKKNRESKIIVNTMHEKIWIVQKLIDAQINGIVFKSSDTSILIQAIETVLFGKIFYCRRFQEIKKHLTNKIYFEPPSSRELEVLKLITQGNSTLQIAEKLFISENTVETHRKQLFYKLQAKNAVDLVMKAQTQGLIAEII
ncbi:MAG: response regulator transcription factor [Firmicutes bacterium]|nr:response regulator transcription factor [Bacillota bacterium]